MTKWALSLASVFLLQPVHAQVQYYLDPRAFPPGHGFPTIELCFNALQGQQLGCFEALITFQESTRLYSVWFSDPQLQCPLAVTQSRIGFPCGDDMFEYTVNHAPFTFIIPDCNNTATPGQVPFFPGIDCTTPIGDLTLGIVGSRLRLSWSPAVGFPVYRVYGLDSPWQQLQEGVLLAETGNTDYEHPLDGDGPRFFRVTALYP